MAIVKKRSLAAASAAGNVNNISGENGTKPKSMYYYFFILFNLNHWHEY